MPAVAASVSAANPVDIGPAVLTDGAEGQWRLGVASYAGGYLAVWTDHRTGFFSPAVMGARLDGTGRSLDPAGLELAWHPGGVWEPSVACAASSCLVAFRDFNQRIMVLTVDVTQGTWSAPVELSDPASVSRARTATAWNGSEYLVVWNESGIVGRRVSDSGQPSGNVLSMFPGTLGEPHVAAAGSDFVVTWESGIAQGFEVRAVVVSAAGASAPIALGQQPSSTSPTVAGGPQQALVLWLEGESATDVFARRLAPDGSVLDPAPVRLGSGRSVRGARAVVSGDSWLVVEELDAHELFLSRWDADGGLVRKSFPPGDRQYEHRPAASGDGGILVWFDTRRWGAGAPYAAQLPTTLDVADAGALLSLSHRNGEPAVAFDDSTFFVVWADTRGKERDIWAARADEEGKVLEPPLQISRDSEDEDRPSVAWTGRRFAVAWREHVWWGVYRPWLAFVDPQTRVVSDAVLLGASDYRENLSRISLAKAGEELWALWSNYGTNPAEGLYLARFDLDGGLAEPPRVLWPRSGHQSDPSLAVNAAGQGLAAFAQSYTPEFVVALRLDSSGRRMDDGGIILRDDVLEAYDPTVASDEEDFLVVWQEKVSSNVEVVYGARIASDGGILDVPPLEVVPPTPIPEAAPDPWYRQVRPAQVVFDGVDYVVGVELPTPDAGQDIFLRRVRRDGGLGPLELAAGTAYEESQLMLAPATVGHVGLVYQTYDPSLRVTRAVIAVSANVPAGAPCAVSTECQNGGPGPLHLRIGCGCNHLPAPIPFMVALGLLGWFRKPIRRVGRGET
ncbi:MAG: hypothetical protein ACOZIN_02355 [Myxococcota bacterium]